MKNILIAIIALFSTTAAASTTANYHLTPVKTNALPAGKAQFEFQVLDAKSKKALAAKNLVKTHTELLHLIAYDPSLTEFQHLHPKYDGKKWTVEMDFKFAGPYYIWAQGETKSGDEFSVMTKVEVNGGLPAKSYKSLGEARENSDGNTVVKLDNSKLKSKDMMTLNFSVSRKDDKPVKIKNYLGAFAHVIAVSQKENELIHVHPMGAGKPNEGMIHASFPKPGEYRIWIQLDEGGEVKTIPLSVVVGL